MIIKGKYLLTKIEERKNKKLETYYLYHFLIDGQTAAIYKKQLIPDLTEMLTYDVTFKLHLGQYMRLEIQDIKLAT